MSQGLVTKQFLLLVEGILSLYYFHRVSSFYNLCFMKCIVFLESKEKHFFVHDRGVNFSEVRKKDGFL